MEISIIIDTNILFVKKYFNYRTIEFFQNFKRLLEDIRLNDFPKKINIILPSIVVEELIQQQIFSYDNEINKLLKYQFPEFEIKKIMNYESYLKDQLMKNINSLIDTSLNVEIFSYPKNLNIERIINRAIKKKAPFEGKDKESDKGFKDVVLWETLIDYKKSNREKTLILCTRDNIFNDSNLKDEYFNYFEENFNIVNWYPGENSLIKLLGEKFNKQVILSPKSTIYEKFSEIMKCSNISELYKRYEFVNNLNNQIYKFKDITIMEIDYLGIRPDIHNGKNIFYFVVEMKVKLDFLDDDYNRIISSLDFYEYEIYYYPDKEQFSIIGFDTPDSNTNYDMEEFFLKRIQKEC